VKNLISQFSGWLDTRVENTSRGIAHRAGRRSFLSRAGWALVGGTVLPMLPFDTFGGAAMARGFGEPEELPEDCEYWRYCSLHGGLCSHCGGTVTQCPPGSTPSKVAWVGTCRNPNDNKDYLVSYNDCCGTGGCETDGCSRQEGDMPGYRMGLASESSWCLANTDNSIHCTLAIVVGLAE